MKFDKQAVMGCIEEILNEAHRCSMDKLVDIANEAFDFQVLPLYAEWTEDDGKPIIVKEEKGGEE